MLVDLLFQAGKSRQSNDYGECCVPLGNERVDEGKGSAWLQFSKRAGEVGQGAWEVYLIVMGLAT